MPIILTRDCGNYSCIAMCSLVRCSNSLTLHTHSPAHWLTLTHTQNSLKLLSTCSHSPELLCTCSLLLIHLLTHTLSNSLKLAHTRLPPTARTRSLSLELVHLLLQNYSVFTRFLHAIPQMNPSATQIPNILISVKDVTTKRNLPPGGWIQLPVRFLHAPVFWDLHMCHPAKRQWNQTIRGHWDLTNLS